MSNILVESTAIPQATGKPGHWSAVLITPGEGSSGKYSEAMLREFGPVALRKGSKCFITHNRLSNGEADPLSLWGVLAEDARYEDGVGLVGDIEVLPSWRDRVAEVAPHTALSVYVMGDKDSDDNVISLAEDAQNGVDMVVYPGRPGSGLVEKLYESARANGEGNRSAEINESESEVEIKDLAALVETNTAAVNALAESVGKLVTLSESAVAAEAEKLDAIKTADEVSKAVTEAKLPEGARKRVIEAVAAGTAVADAVKSESEYIRSIQESLGSTATETTATARQVEGANTKFSLTNLAGV